MAGVLGWTMDSPERIMAGGSPTVEAKPDPDGDLTTLGKELSEAAEAMRSVAVRIEALGQRLQGAR